MKHKQIIIERCFHAHTIETQDRLPYSGIKIIRCTDCGKNVTGMQFMTMAEIKEHYKNGTEVIQL